MSGTEINIIYYYVQSLDSGLSQICEKGPF